jgi:hypothetical protein
VIHEKRDFYLDIESDTVPKHDMLITNPPYSEEHKKKCIEFAMRGLQRDNTPFALLLPTYVATKAYFRECVNQHGLTTDSMVYVVPYVNYSYDHPEGTGKQVSPFRSMWFCGLPKGKFAKVSSFWQQKSKTCDSQPKLYLNLDELEKDKVIKMDHRPNPKQRKKKRKRFEQAASTPTKNSKSSPLLSGECSLVENTSKATKVSKYRDANGQRKRKRF